MRLLDSFLWPNMDIILSYYYHTIIILSKYAICSTVLIGSVCVLFVLFLHVEFSWHFDFASYHEWYYFRLLISHFDFVLRFNIFELLWVFHCSFNVPKPVLFTIVILVAILKTSCYHCHNDNGNNNSLYLRTYINSSVVFRSFVIFTI